MDSTSLRKMMHQGTLCGWKLFLIIQMFGGILEVQPKVNDFKTEHGRNAPNIVYMKQLQPGC